MPVPPQNYSVRERDGKHTATVTAPPLTVNGKPHPVRGAPAKTADAAKRLAAARAVEALTVKQQVEDLSAAGYAEACGSPQDSALRQFVAVGDHEPKPELDHALAFKKGEKVTLTSTAWEDDDDWVHGRTEDGRCGGFPPAKIGAPPPFPHVEPEPDCVQVRTGSVRGGAWGEFFEKVRDDELERRRKLQAAGGTAPHDSKIGVFVRPHPLRRRPRLPPSPRCCGWRAVLRADGRRPPCELVRRITPLLVMAARCSLCVGRAVSSTARWLERAAVIPRCFSSTPRCSELNRC